MGRPWKVKYLSYDDLRGKASAFLSRYHPSGDIPTPIEEIIDLQLKIDIVPVPGLRRYDTDGFITTDMSTIYVDEYLYTSHPNRYRFTLAHEAAHAVLHQEVYRGLGFTDIASWKSAQAAIPDEAYGWLEWQAYAFAGLVLVPQTPLQTQFDGAVQLAASHGVSMANASEASRRLVAGALAREFGVSTEVVERRLEKDGLWEI